MKSLLAKLFTWCVVVAQVTALSGHVLHHAAEPAPASEPGCACPHSPPVVAESDCGHESLPEQRHDCDTCVICETGTPTSLASSQVQSQSVKAPHCTQEFSATTAPQPALWEVHTRLAEPPPQTHHRILLPLLI